MPSDSEDEILFPDLPVIDSHHHLVDRVPPLFAKHLGLTRFLVDDYEQATASGHNLIASVVMEARQMPRASGPTTLRVIGETEFVRGQAAMAASGLYGRCRMGAGFVGYADLRAGASVRDTLCAHIEAWPAFKGIRQEGLWDEDASVLGGLFDVPPRLYDEPVFREGFEQLEPLGLSFDAFVLAPQLSDVARLVRRYPETTVVLNHVGSPVGIGRHAGLLDEQFVQWRLDMKDIAQAPNVYLKLGGLGSFLLGSRFYRTESQPSVDELVAEWRRWVEEAIAIFGPDRCMFESNAPTDGSGSFSAVCNAYKRMTTAYSHEERAAIFAGTAAKAYRLGPVEDLPLPKLSNERPSWLDH